MFKQCSAYSVISILVVFPHWCSQSSSRAHCFERNHQFVWSVHMHRIVMWRCNQSLIRYLVMPNYSVICCSKLKETACNVTITACRLVWIITQRSKHLSDLPFVWKWYALSCLSTSQVSAKIFSVGVGSWQPFLFDLIILQLRFRNQCTLICLSLFCFWLLSDSKPRAWRDSHVTSVNLNWLIPPHTRTSISTTWQQRQILFNMICKHGAKLL